MICWGEKKFHLSVLFVVVVDLPLLLFTFFLRECFFLPDEIWYSRQKKINTLLLSQFYTHTYIGNDHTPNLYNSIAKINWIWLISPMWKAWRIKTSSTRTCNFNVDHTVTVFFEIISGFVIAHGDIMDRYLHLNQLLDHRLCIQPFTFQI